MINENRRKDTCFVLFWLITILLTMITLIIHYIQSGIILGDHEWLWKECACTLQGIDSAIAIQQNLSIPGIGNLPVSTSTLPWTKVIGVLIHGAFLSYELSCIYYILLNILILGWMLLLIYKKIYANTQNSKIALISALSIFSSWYFVDWMQMGNNAGIVCFLTICAICLMDDYEIVSGILIGIALIKPQIVFPFFVVWVIQRRWKVIATSGAVVMVSWILSVWITGISPIMQLSNLLNMRVEMSEDYLVYGLFDQLRMIGMDTKIVLILSMMVGLFVCIHLSMRYHTLEIRKATWEIYVIPAIVSIFWCYKSQCDYNILLIIPLAIVEFWYTCSQKNWKNLFVCMGLTIVCMMKPFSVLGIALDKLGIWSRLDNVYMMNRLDLYVKTFCIIVALVLWTYRRENLERQECV